MASNRHLGRVIVLQSLYEYELRTLSKDPEVDLDTIVAKNIEPYEKALGDTEFVYNLVHNVADNFEMLDTALQPIAPEWPIASIAAIDRNVLRMGLYELSECGDTIPPKVAINEAVELAKAFGSENSSKFVNGVLGTVYKKLGITEEKNHGTESKTGKAKQGGGAKKSRSAEANGEGEATKTTTSATKKNSADEKKNGADGKKNSQSARSVTDGES